MSKKILSVVLALVLVMTTFAVSAFAVGGYGYEDDNTKTQTWALGEPVDNGDGTYSVAVSLTANYVVGAISFQVTSPGEDELVGATLKSATKGAALTYAANIQKNATSGLVVIIPEPGDEDEKGVNLTNGGVVATLTFTLTAESAQIAIKNDPKTKTNKGGDLIAVRLDDENLTTATWIYGQTVTSVGETRNLGGVATVAPELAVIDGTIGVIDTDRTLINEITGEECTGYIYGVDPVDAGETIDSVFEVIGDGEMQIIANEAGSECGTGTLVNVLDIDGNVVATYVLIIFGDVTGDGEATPDDASFIEDHDGWMYGVDADTGEDLLGLEGRMYAYAAFAGDVTGDGEATPDDSSFIEDHDGWMFGIDPDTGDDTLGFGGRITQEYVISLL